VGRTVTPDQRRAWRRRVFGFANVELRPAQKVVLLALETFADYPAGTNARPGINNLAVMCAVDERTVRFALKAGVRLGIIELTARANPKRGLAAVYRLVPQPVSSGSMDPLEGQFNRIRSQFQPDQIDVSTGSVDPPTNPYQLNNHQEHALREPGTSPGQPGRSTDETIESAAHQQTANGKPPEWIRGPFGPRCRAHGHVPAPPVDCTRCRDAATAAEESA
jgi:hypothetical protein